MTSLSNEVQLNFFVRNNELPKSHGFVNTITNKLHMHTQKNTMPEKAVSYKIRP